MSSNEGESKAGTENVSPSSPPVNDESCDASVRKAEATASVIMAKKMARTRNENRPTSSDNNSDTSKAAATPSASAPQPGASTLESEIATPYAPMPKNMVWAKLTMPV